jgi:hypothetical protein
MLLDNGNYKEGKLRLTQVMAPTLIFLEDKVLLADSEETIQRSLIIQGYNIQISSKNI